MTSDAPTSDWEPDPLGRFEERWISKGAPTSLVRNGADASFDPVLPGDDGADTLQPDAQSGRPVLDDLFDHAFHDAGPASREVAAGESRPKRRVHVARRRRAPGDGSSSDAVLPIASEPSTAIPLADESPAVAEPPSAAEDEYVDNPPSAVEWPGAPELAAVAEIAEVPSPTVTAAESVRLSGDLRPEETIVPPIVDLTPWRSGDARSTEQNSAGARVSLAEDRPEHGARGDQTPDTVPARTTPTETDASDTAAPEPTPPDAALFDGAVTRSAPTNVELSDTAPTSVAPPDATPTHVPPPYVALTDSVPTDRTLTDRALTDSILTEGALTDSVLINSALTDRAPTDTASPDTTPPDTTPPDMGLTRAVLPGAEPTHIAPPVRDPTPVAPARMAPPESSVPDSQPAGSPATDAPHDAPLDAGRRYTAPPAASSDSSLWVDSDPWPELPPGGPLEPAPRYDLVLVKVSADRELVARCLEVLLDLDEAEAIVAVASFARHRAAVIARDITWPQVASVTEAMRALGGTVVEFPSGTPDLLELARAAVRLLAEENEPTTATSDTSAAEVGGEPETAGDPDRSPRFRRLWSRRDELAEEAAPPPVEAEPVESVPVAPPVTEDERAVPTDPFVAHLEAAASALAELDELSDAGAITYEQHARERAEILDGIRVTPADHSDNATYAQARPSR